MKYVLREFEAAARSLVDFGSCARIGKDTLKRDPVLPASWVRGGQVRLGSFIYNIGPDAVEKLNKAGILRGHS